MKALVGGFYQEKDLVGAFSVIVKTDCKTDVSFAALVTIFTFHTKHPCVPAQPLLVMTAADINQLLTAEILSPDCCIQMF